MFFPTGLPDDKCNKLTTFRARINTSSEVNISNQLAKSQFLTSEECN